MHLFHAALVSFAERREIIMKESFIEKCKIIFNMDNIIELTDGFFDLRINEFLPKFRNTHKKEYEYYTIFFQICLCNLQQSRI